MYTSSQPRIIITAQRQSGRTGLRELVSYRELIWAMTRKNYIIRYKQTVLGIAWAFIRPLFTALVMSVAFGQILGLKTDGLPGLLFYLCNMSLWGFFSESVRSNSRLFLDNAALFGKIYFPRLVMPISNLLLNMMTLGIQILMLTGFVVCYSIQGALDVSLQLWPLMIPVVLITGAIGMSFGVIVSSLTTRYRDLNMLVDFAIQLWMYATPVVYPLSQVQNPVFRRLLLLNPMTSLMECFRKIFLGSGCIQVTGLLWTCIFAVLSAVLAVHLFYRIESTFLDTV